MSRERELLTRLYLALPDGDDLPRIMNEVRALLTVASTPRYRAEAEACKWTPLPDDDIWQTECGGLYQVGPNSVADAVISEALRCPCGKRITADPNALPSPVLRSRAEAAAMVWDFERAVREYGILNVDTDARGEKLKTARAALLAALTGEGT